MNQHIRLICNPFLMILSFVTTIAVATCAIGMILLVGVDGIMSSPKEILPVQILFGVLLCCFVLAMVVSSPRICAFVVLSKESITYRTLLQKPKTYPYRHYSYIYKASYIHRNVIGVGYRVDFMVFSSSYLSKEDCLNINKFPISEDLIKIRYSKTAYQKLYSILPISHQLKLKKAFMVQSHK